RCSCSALPTGRGGIPLLAVALGDHRLRSIPGVWKDGRSAIASPAHGEDIPMDYKQAFRTALDNIRSEGRYRVFADLKRHRGAFPQATWTQGDGTQRDVVV